VNFGAQRAAHGEILAHGFLHARLLVRPAAIDDVAGGALKLLELAPPVPGLAPAGQGAATAAQLFNPVHALAARVPEQVQVGREMHVSLQDVAVHLELKRRVGRAGFFCEHPASCGGETRVDLLQQFVVEQGHVVAQRLVAEHFFIITPRHGGHLEHLAHEQMMIGHVFHAIPVRVEPQTHDAQHEDLPQIHPGAAGDFFAREDFGLDEAEDLGLERGVHPEPLESGEEGRQLIAAAQRQTNLFDGRDLEIRLGLVVVAHDECLEIRSSKRPKRSKKVPTFAQARSHFHQCQPRPRPFSRRHY